MLKKFNPEKNLIIFLYIIPYPEDIIKNIRK